jgi:hypothetical protein
MSTYGESERRAILNQLQAAWVNALRGPSGKPVPVQVLAAAKDAIRGLQDLSPQGEASVEVIVRLGDAQAALRTPHFDGVTDAG